jgi:sugar lactone lactonase YvrE
VHVPGSERSDFTFYYQQWVTDSGNAFSQASTAAMNGNNLLLSIPLFILSYFFNPGSDDVQFSSVGKNGLLAAQPQRLTWSDNIIQLADYTFQVQRNQNQDDPDFGQYKIVSIRPVSSFPVDISENPLTLPNTFVLLALARTQTISLNSPAGVAVDDSGNVYVAETGAQVIRKMAPLGSITRIAGTGTLGYSGDGGPAPSATFRFPFGLAVDGAGSLYVGDLNNAVVRKISPSGIIATVAGAGQGGYSGDRGPATRAQLSERPYTVALDSGGALYISDTWNHCIRRVATDGIITTVAGNGTAGYSGDGGAAVEAQLNIPTGVAVDQSGILYIADIADNNNNRIRRVARDGRISTVVGTGVPGYSGDGGPAVAANLKSPWHVAVDKDGTLYIADWGNQRIRAVSPGGSIRTVAGNGTGGYTGDGGLAVDASLKGPIAVAIDSSGNIFIADGDNNCIRKVTQDGVIGTIIGRP